MCGDVWKFEIFEKGIFFSVNVGKLFTFTVPTRPNFLKSRRRSRATFTTEKIYTKFAANDSPMSRQSGVKR